MTTFGSVCMNKEWQIGPTLVNRSTGGDSWHPPWIKSRSRDRQISRGAVSCEYNSSSKHLSPVTNKDPGGLAQGNSAPCRRTEGLPWGGRGEGAVVAEGQTVGEGAEHEREGERERGSYLPALGVKWSSDFIFQPSDCCIWFLSSRPHHLSHVNTWGHQKEKQRPHCHSGWTVSACATHLHCEQDILAIYITGGGPHTARPIWSNILHI